MQGAHDAGLGGALFRLDAAPLAKQYEVVFCEVLLASNELCEVVERC